MDELRNFTKGEAAPVDAVQHAPDEIVGSGEPLGGIQLPSCVVQPDEVRESAPDIYRDKEQSRYSTLRLCVHYPWV